MELMSACSSLEFKSTKPPQEIRSIVRGNSTTKRAEYLILDPSKLREVQIRLHKLKSAFLKRDYLVDHLLTTVIEETQVTAEFTESSRKLTQRMGEIENIAILHKRLQDLQRFNTELSLKLEQSPRQPEAPDLKTGGRKGCWSRTRNTGLCDTRNYNSNKLLRHREMDVISKGELRECRDRVASARHAVQTQSVLDGLGDKRQCKQNDVVKYTMIALVKKAQDQILRNVYKMDYRLNKQVEVANKIKDTLRVVMEKGLNTAGTIERANQLKSLEERMETLKESMLQEYKILERENKQLKAKNKELVGSLERYKKTIKSQSRENSSRNLTLDHYKTKTELTLKYSSELVIRVHSLKEVFNGLFSNHNELIQKKLGEMGFKLNSLLADKRYKKAKSNPCTLRCYLSLIHICRCRRAI
eukprot:TRINITY_DN8444_c0_g2_i12.p2 TRINITY_DN8444_c0_g2~~TRINITY_DN8444_c0_g2_i12.p2  ORF type:complete len:415 (+),score=109.25 TRINITY_DN8444_c0_g2_i12:1770-3014(+)